MVHIHVTPTHLPTTAGWEIFTLKYFCKLTLYYSVIIAEALYVATIKCSTVIVHRILCMSHSVWLHVFNKNKKYLKYGISIYTAILLQRNKCSRLKVHRAAYRACPSL